jgi:iron complex outermembrane receptor protein
MPSMAQMFSSDINLGSVRDYGGNSPFVRQAQIGNPNLKPATSINTNIGIILDSANSTISIDFWSIDYKDRIEVQSAQAMLSLDPNGISITRNNDGELIGVTTTYFNEERTDLSGVDINYETLLLSNIKYGEIKFSLQGTSLNEFLTPGLRVNNVSNMINRVGKFNFDANTHSLPKKRVNAFTNWKYQNYDLILNARYIDGYTNERAINSLGLSYGYQNKVDSFLVFDLSLKRLMSFNRGELALKVYASNIFDESAPRLYDAPDFSFDTRVHDPRGRILGINFEYTH